MKGRALLVFILICAVAAFIAVCAMPASSQTLLSPLPITDTPAVRYTVTATQTPTPEPTPAYAVCAQNQPSQCEPSMETPIAPTVSPLYLPIINNGH